MGRGEVLTFEVEREARVGFTESEEWVETIVDHPIWRLGRIIVFPPERPCRSATLCCEGFELPLPIIRQPDGTTLVCVDVPSPRANMPYTVRWSW
jgi:hypothetical protein